MRILFLTHSFNSLSQRLYAELRADGHDLSVEFDIADSVTREAVDLYRPDVIVAPFLKRAIPESVWSRHLCLIVHPGIVGDRGPSALDWAILEERKEWGITVLQANAEMDAGDIWATATFPLRAGTKASLYRTEVTEAALKAVREALTRVPDWRAGRWQPTPLATWTPPPLGRERPAMKQGDRAIAWDQDATATVLAKLRSADGFPGLADRLFGISCHLFDAHPGPAIPDAAPGQPVARKDGAVLVATTDGSVWIGHAKRADADHPFKLPATVAFAREAADLPEWTGDDAFEEIRYTESEDGLVGFLEFAFYNGAMSTGQCEKLATAIREAAGRPTRVLVLLGGRDFWSNGIHLNMIEAAESPSDESWRNINAMNDACLAILEATGKFTIAALRGNAGAGGCFLALAADQVWARRGVILNPHYKNMGNLFGSEYWTYLLPRRVGEEGARRLMADRLPLRAQDAATLGLIDSAFGLNHDDFEAEVRALAEALAASPDLPALLAEKQHRRATDEAAKPLASYREEELAHMRRNFYGFDPSYHVARYHFVLKTPQSWTPRHLARHRDLGWTVPADEPVTQAA